MPAATEKVKVWPFRTSRDSRREKIRGRFDLYDCFCASCCFCCLIYFFLHMCIYVISCFGLMFARCICFYLFVTFLGFMLVFWFYCPLFFFVSYQLLLFPPFSSWLAFDWIHYFFRVWISRWIGTRGWRNQGKRPRLMKMKSVSRRWGGCATISRTLPVCFRYAPFGIPVVSHIVVFVVSWIFSKSFFDKLGSQGYWNYLLVL